MSITPQSEPISKIKENQIIKLLSSGKRLDGRGLLDYRDVKVDVGVIDKAEGSAMVSLGNTKVLVGVKVETGKPYPDLPNQGALTVNAEFVPLAHRYFEPGPPDENSIELARVVDRGIRGSGSIDLKKLTIIEGNVVYVVFVDIYILNHDGNLTDASALATITALINSRVPVYKVSGNEIKKVDEYFPMPIVAYPITVTVAKISDNIIVDPTLDEETISTAKLTVALTENGNICAMQKSGIGTFTIEESINVQKIAREKSYEIRAKILGGKIEKWEKQKS
ncbi:MAG: exosome complex protein Rrp42 [Candidatus Bathyarchaeota archaeon]|nr:exosome complex protein Rrp42 [Candidatus Bathyarchaeota archaeon]